jgi:hypothetical protein
MPIVDYDQDHLVSSHRGTMPVLLTSPHGGTSEPPDVERRTKEATPGSCRFVVKSDLHTAEIARCVAQVILDRTGLSPYVVIADFDRAFIDANRPRSPVNCAFIDPDAQPFYDAYHGRIATFVDEIRSQNDNRGFLFDVHGKVEIPTDPADIYLGTDQGGSLLPGFDRASLFVQHGLHGLLGSVRRETDPASAVFRYRLSPADAQTPESSSVDGGFTSRQYGEFINSVQVEIADTIRTCDDCGPIRTALGEDLALAIVNFVRRHAPF